MKLINLFEPRLCQSALPSRLHSNIPVSVMQFFYLNYYFFNLNYYNYFMATRDFFADFANVNS